MAVRIQDLIDIEQFQLLQDRLNEIYSFPSAIIGNDGSVLTATAWQDICTKFHRQHDECLKECIKSDQYIASHLHEANPAVSYRCPHGLIDNATPIIIDGVHYGNFFTGQFFLEPPDLDSFRAQAKRYGFDEAAYLDAVKKVPIWTEEQVHSYLFFIKGLIEVISGIGLKNLKEIETRRKMQESEERYRAILATALDGFWRVDLQGRLLEVNETYCRMSGYREQELLAMRISDLEAAEEQSGVADHIKRIIAQGEDRFETRHRRKDGSTFDVEIGVQYRPTESGQIVAFLRDISDRKRAEAEIVLLNERISMATRSAQVGIWDWDVVNDRLIWDDQMYALYGVDKAAFSGAYEAWTRGLHPDDAASCEEESRRALSGESDYDTEFRVIWPEGAVHVLKAQGDVIRDSQGQPLRMVGVNYDITEHKHAEEEKAKLEAQLQQAQKMESVGRLAGGVAHDFNNMLGVILGHTELAMDKIGTDQPLHGDLQAIRNAAHRSADLTRQLLAFARKQTVSPRVLDLNETLAGMLNMLQRLIGEDIHLSWLPDLALWSIKIDPTQIDQILANLCVNARDAIAGVGELTIETGNHRFDAEYCADHPGFTSGEYVLLAVSDDGCGMDRQTINSIFEPFFTTKGLGKGTGLGLSTIYGIVKQNNGFINVYSEPGQGTTFRIYLPRHLGQPELEQTAGLPDPPAHGQETVLVVEDEPAILGLTRLMLEKQGYCVLTAGTPSEAIRLAEIHAGEIHLLMTDVVMPEMDGRALAEKLLGLCPHLKCLFTSGYTADVIAHHGVLDDGVTFIQKPFSRYDLATKVRAALRGK
jgi:two-component system cell cycle sensor histidine kinase/response regulator CckA